MPRIREQLTGSGFISRSPRLLLRELDDHAGSFSTVKRTGDINRPGTLTTNFDDNSTIIFSETGNPVFPSMLPQGNQFNSQAVDALGQESDISIIAPIRSAQHPTYLHYSSEEQMGPFDENRVMPATDFFLSGTDPDIIPGFMSSIRSKIAFTFDITPQHETLLTRNVKSRSVAETGARAQGSLTIGNGAGALPPPNFELSITSSDGSSRIYRFMGGATGEISFGKIIVSSDGTPTPQVVAGRYKDAIQSANGHAGRIDCNAMLGDPALVTIKQAVGGVSGNTLIVPTPPGPFPGFAKTDFTGGADNGTSIDDQSGFMYYNFIRKAWEQIGLAEPQAPNPALAFDYTFNSSAISGTFPAQFSTSPSFTGERVQDRIKEGYTKIGTPMDTMDAPTGTKYHATSSQLLRLSDYISSPILLEGISVNFGEVNAKRTQGDCLSSFIFDRNGGARDIDNYVFFAYRQDRSFKRNEGKDSIANISGSIRSLIFSGSMSFWNSSSFFNDDAAGARLLHSPAFEHNFMLPYSGSFITGSFIGPISLQLKPAVAGRQMSGVGRYFNVNTPKTILSRNFWPGGTTPAVSQKEYAIAGTIIPTVDAHSWSLNPDNAKFSQTGDSRSFRIYGGESAVASLVSSGTELVISSDVEQSVISPYLLLPTDELVFGLDAGISPTLGSFVFSSMTGSQFRIAPKKCSVTFYGSLIKNGVEHLSSLNQNLSSNSVHEIIGAEPVLDKFQIEPISSYHGSYLDEIVTGSMADPILGGASFITASQDSSRRVISKVSLGQAGTTGSLQRFVKMIDQSERAYDSCLPDIFTFVDQPNIGVTGSAVYIGQGIFNDSVNEYFKFLPNQFPFATNPKRNIEGDEISYLESDTTEASDLIEAYPTIQNGLARIKDLVFRVKWKIEKRSVAYLGIMAHRFKNVSNATASERPISSGTFRYGISNINPEFSSARWSATSYGQPRDLLESRLGITTSNGTPPVKISFISGSTSGIDPNNTHSQNLSTFATSSIPWFDDGLFINREDNPDETLLIV